MSSALEALKRGDVDAALKQLTDEVRKDPSSPKLRVFLFQMLAVTGQWDRALTQLDTVHGMDDSAMLMVQMYRTAIDCEKYRAEVFAGRQTPMLFGEPQEWMALMLEALKHSAAGRLDKAEQVRATALESAQPTPGSVNGEPFEWIMDADSRLGPILEVIVNGRYYWCPFARLAKLRVEPPQNLRDAVWAPVQITWSNGGESVGLVPTRYPGSASAEDDALKLARLTAWEQVSEQGYHGLGQRMLATDAGEYPLLEVRELVLESSVESADAVAPAAEGTETGEAGPSHG